MVNIGSRYNIGAEKSIYIFGNKTAVFVIYKSKYVKCNSNKCKYGVKSLASVIFYYKSTKVIYS